MPYRIVLGRPLHPAGAAVLAARADVETIEMFDPPAPALHAALTNADGLIAWLERVDKAALAAAPRCWRSATTRPNTGAWCVTSGDWDLSPGASWGLGCSTWPPGSFGVALVC
jgi:hypothetical protein